MCACDNQKWQGKKIQQEYSIDMQKLIYMQGLMFPFLKSFWNLPVTF